ncbi:hypothetical protein ACQVP6_28230 [Bacillus cereus]|uniref:hypothetical protein n=1 Tax=Bacillus cereus TaxID=1396 RepID=UPI003D65DD48
MKVTVTQECMLGGVKELEGKSEKKKAMYTLLTLPGFEKVVVFGDFVQGLKERQTVQATFDITIKSQRMLDTKGEAQFVDVAKIFLKEIKG